MAHDQVGAGVDDGVGEADDVSAVPAEVALVAPGDVLALGPSAPPCMATTTRSAVRAARRTRRFAAAMSVSEADQSVGAKPTSATSTEPTGWTLTWPRRPVWPTPADASASTVWRRPGSPRSYAWSFARLTTVKPASREPRCVGRRDAVGATALGPGRTARRAAVGERRLEVAEDDVAREVGLDIGEEAAAVVGRQNRRGTERDIARRRDRDGHGGGRPRGHLADGRPRRRLRGRLDGRAVGDGLLGPVDEERDDDDAQGDDCARTHDQRDDAHGLRGQFRLPRKTSA